MNFKTKSQLAGINNPYVPRRKENQLLNVLIVIAIGLSIAAVMANKVYSLF